MLPEFEEERLIRVSRALSSLSPRERTVLPHLIAGRKRVEIGRILDLSPRTVDVHATRIKKAMGVRYFHEAIMYVLAVAWGIDQPPPRDLPVLVVEEVDDSKLTCLECGRTMALLGTHLWRRHRMAPADYLAKYRLPESYPMTAPATRRHRQRQAEKADLRNTATRRAWRPAT